MAWGQAKSGELVKVGTVVKIAVIEQPEDKALGATPEAWVQVQSNELLDWPRVKAQLDEAQASVLLKYADKPAAYHPALLEGGDINAFKYEDWFIFKPRGY